MNPLHQKKSQNDGKLFQNSSQEFVQSGVLPQSIYDIPSVCLFYLFFAAFNDGDSVTAQVTQAVSAISRR